jgi:hypothetical protein
VIEMRTPRLDLTLWGTWVVVALLALPLLDTTAYGVVVPVSALVVSFVPRALPRTSRRWDRTDLVAVAAWLAARYERRRTRPALPTSAEVPGR